MLKLFMVIRGVVVFCIFILLGTMTAQAQVPSFVGQVANNDDSVYPGYYWGAAGIVDGLMKLYSSSNFPVSLKTDTKNLILSGLDGIWGARTTDSYGNIIPAWSKIPGWDIYPGVKYGAAGIINSFLNAYQLFGNQKYLEWANASLFELYKEATPLNGSHWPYEYSNVGSSVGIYITDISYGSLGIINTTLNLYEVTKNPILLKLSLDAANWLYNVSDQVTIKGKSGKVLPWYQSNTPVNNTYTSYNQGNAGAIPILHRLAILTNQTKWNDWSSFILDWLISKQYVDGFWVQQSAPLTITPSTEFEVGVSGIVYALYQVNSWSNNSLVPNSIDKGVQWLLSQFVSNSTHQIFQYYNNTQYARYGFMTGMTGINFVLRQIQPDLKQLKESYDWIINHALYQFSTRFTKLLGLFSSTFKENFIDLSLYSGLTGVILELSRAAGQGIISLDSTLLELYINTMKFYQLDSGMWERQVVPDVSIFQKYPIQIVVLTILIIVLIVLLYRRRRRFRT